MTAEVCVMNTMGIALAADSAVSIGEGSRKIYNSANKLFSLSHSVGIMIYGNADFMDVPWETIIKTFRNKNLSEELNYLEDYAENFIDYLTKGSLFSNIDAEMRYVLNICQIVIDEILEEDIANLIIDSINNNDIFYKNEFLKALNDRITFLSPLETVHKINLFNMFKQDYYISVKEILLDTVFFEIDENIIYNLIKCTYLFIIKDVYSLNFHTGIVIAGFGEKDYFPKLFEYSIGGTFYGELKYSAKESIEISNTFNSARAAIRPFAQKEMIYTVMNGIDPDLSNYIDEKMYNTLSNQFDNIVLPTLENILNENDILKLKIQYIQSSLVEIENEKQKYVNDNFKDPVLNVLATFPKEELAAMAETLINLTSFKRKVSFDLETVGGPIDVAVITKGDGFIWVKRKHYFDPILNSDYFNRKQKRQLL